MERFIHSEKKPEKNMLEIPNKYIPKLEQFQIEHPEIVYKYYLKIIEEAINRNKNKAKFYKIEGTNVIAGVEESDYLETLYEMQEAFVEKELYELASDCKKLIYNFQINKVISDSQKR